MALYIQYTDKSHVMLHINTIRPVNLENNRAIEFIQADGHELELIQNTFRINGRYTIPMTNKKIVKWHGDIARTIIANLV